jgi:tetratricopeptide (TPR) repeat protein
VPLQRRALNINEASYGPNHPNVATNLNNLANMLESMRQFGEAEQLYRRALAIFHESFGPNHPNTTGALTNLAGLKRTRVERRARRR